MTSKDSKLLSTRQLSFMALGMAIGVGLFLGSASAIKAAGPGVLFVYCLCGGVIFLVMRALGELTVRNPSQGSFAAYAHNYLGPFAGYLVGWNYWITMVGVGIAESTAVAVYMKMWYPDVPQWIWVFSAIASIGLLNLLAVKVYGEIEFWFSLIKVVAILALIACGTTIIAFGWGNQGVPLGLSNLWRHGGWLPHGVTGLLNAIPIVAYSFAGIEMIAIASAEARDPQTTIPRSINSVIWRILLFYVLALGVILAIYPWNQIGLDGSPFVVTFERIGIAHAAGIVNFVILTAALSSFNCILFSGARILRNLALQDQAPGVFRARFANGIPGRAVLATLACTALGVILNYVIPDKAFGAMMSILAFNVIFNWVFIVLTHVGFRRAVPKAQRNTGFVLPAPNVSAVVSLAFCGFVLYMLGDDPDSRISIYAGVAWTVLAAGAYYVRSRARASANVRIEARPGLEASRDVR
ncbi:amino acid permease [Pandoraea captiosa]|uniref:Amino acid permease n=1 Tax=Pandoraea captiosa TaxID=2508302 RepID=A0A5E4ZGV9_9BURK|nr:amino acid permease [Pandoraea captiosa]VVE60569.1 amino acid permease [Pandoraea captiosa]